MRHNNRRRYVHSAAYGVNVPTFFRVTLALRVSSGRRASKGKEENLYENLKVCTFTSAFMYFFSNENKTARLEVISFDKMTASDSCCCPEKCRAN